MIGRNRHCIDFPKCLSHEEIMIRDTFAGMAMQGQMQREKDFGITIREQGFEKYAAHIAQTAYQIADAMLAERAK